MKHIFFCKNFLQIFHFVGFFCIYGDENCIYICFFKLKTTSDKIKTFLKKITHRLFTDVIIFWIIEAEISYKQL